MCGEKLSSFSLLFEVYSLVVVALFFSQRCCPHFCADSPKQLALIKRPTWPKGQVFWSARLGLPWLRLPCLLLLIFALVVVGVVQVVVAVVVAAADDWPGLPRIASRPLHFIYRSP